MTDKLKLSFKSIVLPTTGEAVTPQTFLIINMLMRLWDLGHEEYARAWVRQLRISQTTDKFDRCDAICSLEAAWKRKGGVGNEQTDRG